MNKTIIFLIIAVSLSADAQTWREQQRLQQKTNSQQKMFDGQINALRAEERPPSHFIAPKAGEIE